MRIEIALNLAMLSATEFDLDMTIASCGGRGTAVGTSNGLAGGLSVANAREIQPIAVGALVAATAIE